MKNTTTTTAPAGTYNLFSVQMIKKGRGQYTIIAELKNGRRVSYHSTDSIMFDDFSNADIFTAEGRNIIRRVLNAVIRQYNG
jgi:hypothetical protein